MSNRDDGGAAYPNSVQPDFQYAETGMSLRDYFAGQALSQSVLDYGEPSANGSAGQRRNRGNQVLPYSTEAVGTREEIIAWQAYKYADAMLKERSK